MQPFGEGKPAFELLAGDFLHESLAWTTPAAAGRQCPRRQHPARLHGRQAGPFIKPDAANGLWGVYAMATDSGATCSMSPPPPDLFQGLAGGRPRQSGVFKFQLSSGKFLERYPAPGTGPHLLTSLAVGKTGALFVADGVRNLIYKIEGKELKVAVADPNLRSIRGLAVSDDGKLLYFADYELGLFGVHLATGKGFPVTFNPKTLVLGGIDGLYWYDGTLVVIENGMHPQRVLRLTLSAEGSTITKVMPIDVAHPASACRPTARSPVTRSISSPTARRAATPGGELRAGAEPEPVKVFRSDLRFAWDQSGINTSATPVRAAPFEASSSCRHDRAY